MKKTSEKKERVPIIEQINFTDSQHAIFLEKFYQRRT